MLTRPKLRVPVHTAWAMDGSLEPRGIDSRWVGCGSFPATEAAPPQDLPLFFDRTCRLPFHHLGQPPGPRHLWPREQVFHPPAFAFAMSDQIPGRFGYQSTCRWATRLSRRARERGSGTE